MPIVQPGLLKRPGMGSCHLLGAEPMSDWTVCRIAGKTLTDLAAEPKE